MVSHVNRERDIHPRKRFGDGVAGEYRYGCGSRGWKEVESDDLSTQSPANFLQQAAVAAADIEHATNRDWIVTQKAQQRRRVAKPAMRLLKFPVGPCHHSVRE